MKKYILLIASIFVLTFQGFTQKISEEEVKKDLEDGIVSFVHAVKPAYVENMSESDFLKLLVGGNNLSTITAEGRSLISKAYTFITAGASDEKIREEGLSAMAAAANFVFKYNIENSLPGTDPKGSIQLFGGDESSFNGTIGEEARAAPCKWYQLGCHLKKLWAWIGENSEQIGVIIAIVALFL